MDEHDTANQSGSFQITFESSEYTVVAGQSVDVVANLQNTGPWGDYYRFNLLGIPPSWITHPGPPTIWVAERAQERVAVTICPPTDAEGVSGTYPFRIYIYGQSAPENGKEHELRLTVLPVEKIKRGIELRVGTNEIQLNPGAEAIIPLAVINLSPEPENLEVTVLGVPGNWVSLPTPVVNLAGGEEKHFELKLQIPTSPEIRAGYIPVKITASSQKDPAIRKEVDVKLGIGAFEWQGRVGVMLTTSQFSVSPGGSVMIPLTVLNRGLDADGFRLGVEGIPVNWVSTNSPVTVLEPGKSKEISILIRPPLAPSSQAGRYKMNIVISSQAAPEEMLRVKGTLTVSAFSKSSIQLEPREVNAGKPVRVTVKNEGNTQQVFYLTCTSQNNALVFEFLQPEISSSQLENPVGGVKPPQDPTSLAVMSGEAAVFQFTARPRNRQLFGGVISYPYQVSVAAKQKEVLILPGQVNDRGAVPLWVLPIVLLLCVILPLGYFAFRALGGAPVNSATETAVAYVTQAAGPTQTLLAGTAMSSAATQTIIANQTAAAIAGQQDSDGDGLTNQREAEIKTDPNNADTDADGLLDGEEVFQTGTNPFNPDSDVDGAKDGDEVRMRTNPLDQDTDKDGLKDGDEVGFNTNPLNPDSDADSLLDGSENQSCPFYLNPDTDRDGITDGRDLSPCDQMNPALTQTAFASLPTLTAIPPTLTPVPPTFTPAPVSTLTSPPPTSIPLPRFRGVILFESDRDGNPEIYSINDSGQIKRMTNDPGFDMQAAWSPNMQKFAFTSNRNGQNDIYLMNADGSGIVNLTNNPADDQHPAWSVDGQSIIFTSNRGGSFDIYALTVSNLEIRRLTDNPANETQPNYIRSNTFDPSFDYIIFTSNRDGNLEIYRMKVDGSEVVNLTVNPANDSMGKGSPDATIIVYTSDRDGNQEIYSMRLDGKGPVNLTNNPASDSGPSWSGDQAWVVFTTDRTGNREVFLTKPGLYEYHNITNHPSQDKATDLR